ncbi:hybrid sensor histidine kinase/response regulator [Pacificibacter sp. AS14]|uniref:hybrid sensor histidine kinase/response regulator n=1 Tax=Pacificibacter sp. AS14 TaxID=3135785 RepID=UPI00316BD18B
MAHKDDIARHPTTVRVADAGLFSFLSHDIRSSFSEVSAGLNALSYSLKDTQSRNDVRQLIAASDHLGRLLRDALTMVAGEHAIQPPEFGDTNVGEFLSTLFLRWNKIVVDTGVVLEFDAHPSLPQSLQIDVLAVERILSNLVSNAARHAKGGKIELHAEYCEQKGLCITVRDHGDGFTQAQLATIFDFPPAPVGAGEPGSGYGLRIAYSLCESMGGTLRAKNAKDGGAILTLKLPAPSIPEIAPYMQNDTVMSLLQGRSALIVDDGAVHRISLRAQLEGIGLLVEEADGGAEAIDALLRHKFDLMFLDIEMPIFSGIDLLQTLRERKITLPATIGVTVHVFERNHAAIKAAGALSVLNKPVSNAAYLHNAILSALHLAPPFTPGTLSETRIGAFCAETHIQNLGALIEALNPDARQTFLSQLENDFSTQLTTAQNLVAREMSQIDKEAFARCAHALAGLFATSYAPAAHQRALDMERKVFTAHRSEVIALLDTLSQDAKIIKKTIHLLKHKK